MPEMHAVSRFFVNRSAARRARREYRWIREEVQVPYGSRCLEVGCGNGDMAIRFLEGFRPVQYLATDIDPTQLRAAQLRVQKRYPGAVPSALVLREANMVSLPFTPDSFDVVLAFVTIHHSGPTHHNFSTVPQALSEFDRVLVPGGLLVYQEFLHKDAIRKWLTDHGFVIERVRRRWRLESVAARKPSRSPQDEQRSAAGRGPP